MRLPSVILRQQRENLGPAELLRAPQAALARYESGGGEKPRNIPRRGKIYCAQRRGGRGAGFVFRLYAAFFAQRSVFVLNVENSKICLQRPTFVAAQADAAFAKEVAAAANVATKAVGKAWANKAKAYQKAALPLP